MNAVHLMELEWILALQKHATLAPIMRLFTELGPGQATFVLVGAIYLLVDRAVGARLAVVFFLSMWLNEMLKMGIHSPRPFWIDSRVDAFHHAGRQLSYSFPSGHAFEGATFWFFLCTVASRTWAWLAAGVIVALIGLSRVFFGVHFPSDVLFGIVGGLLWLGVFVKFSGRAESRLSRSTFEQQILIVSITAILIFTGGVATTMAIAGTPDPEFWSAFNQNARSLARFERLAGLIFGTGTGLAMAHRFARFDPQGPLEKRLLRVIIAGAGYGVIRLFASDWFVGDFAAVASIIRFLSAAAAGWWLFFGTPWLADLRGRSPR